MTMTTGEAEELVDRYLSLFMEGRVAEAESMLAPNAALIFPGGAVQTSLSDVAAEVGRLYESVGKTITRTWSAHVGDDIVVTTTGYLFGTSRTFGPFADVRFIDFFTVRDGKIIAQEVINDAAQVGVVEPYSRAQSEVAVAQ
jgi:ketosteroid isomerase-like protein